MVKKMKRSNIIAIVLTLIWTVFLIVTEILLGNTQEDVIEGQAVFFIYVFLNILTWAIIMASRTATKIIIDEKINNLLLCFGVLNLYAAILSPFLIFIYQIFNWLKFGEWKSISVLDAIFYLLSKKPPDSSVNFLIFLDEWVGIQKMLAFFPLAFALFLLFGGIGFVTMKFFLLRCKK